MHQPEDTSGFRVVGHSDLDVRGEGVQVMPLSDVLYVAHFGPSGKGTTILDICDKTEPRVGPAIRSVLVTTDGLVAPEVINQR